VSHTRGEPHCSSAAHPARQTPESSQYDIGSPQPVTRQSTGDWQKPSTQRAPVGQTWPQTPQLCGSLSRRPQTGAAGMPASTVGVGGNGGLDWQASRIRTAAANSARHEVDRLS
jgi:hypothetical protein